MLDSVERFYSHPIVWGEPDQTTADKENEAHRRFGARLFGVVLTMLTVGIAPSIDWTITSGELTVREAELLVERQGSTIFKHDETYDTPVLYGRGPCGLWHSRMIAFQVLAPNNQDWRNVYVCDALLFQPVVVYGDVIELGHQPDSS